jgi:peptidoglycan-associated lipoprotein
MFKRYAIVISAALFLSVLFSMSGIHAADNYPVLKRPDQFYGKVISGTSEKNLLAFPDLVVTDMGAADNEEKRGVKIGDRFSIYEKNLKVKKDDQGRFLFEKIGEIEIVKVFDQKSIGRITKSSKEMFMELGRTFYLDEIIQAAPVATAPPMAPAAMPVVPKAKPSPTPPPVVTETESLGADAEFTREVVYFAFDDAGLTEPGMALIEKKAQFLKQHPDKKTLIEGHCDERGSVEYNLALGERRAAAVRNQLISFGVDSGRIRTVSYGKERPVDPAHTEEAWAKNRRAEFILE